MEHKITTENVLSTLLLMEYTKISSVFYSVLVNKLYALEEHIKVIDEEFSEPFKYCTIIDLEGFHLKKGCNLETNVAHLCNVGRRYFIFKDYINTSCNRDLMEYIKKNISLIEIEKEEYDLLSFSREKDKTKRKIYDKK